MYAQCTTEKASDQQRRFEDALLEALETTAYSGVTVKSLCQRAGLSRMTFYRLFDGKVDVLHALIDRVLLEAQSFQMDLAGVDSGVSGYFQRHYTYWRCQKPLLKALSDNDLSAVLMERAMRHIALEDATSMRLLGVEGAWNQREVLRFFVSGMMGLVLLWYESGFEKSVRQMAQITTQLVTRPPLLFQEPSDTP